MQLGVCLVSLVMLASALVVVAGRNLFRAALSLGAVLLSVAVLFLLLEAEFLAFVQVLIYVGAILTLMVFAIMLTPQRVQAAPTVGRQQLPALAVSLALFALLAKAVWSAPWPETALAEAVALPQLGHELVTTLVLPFEVISLVFVAAIVGAVAMASGARRDPR